jgi:UPF0716 family protein affecting phage T7 exclusion
MVVIPVAVFCAAVTVIGTGLTMLVVVFPAFFGANPASFFTNRGNLIG